MGNVFTRLIRAVKRSLWRAEQREVERYLAEATDNADLERRLRDLERTGFHGSYR
ncbi:MAG: DUF3563 family protein [Burkholderiales bacterium]|nr:DUF3563 family protein [Burkholderiales bacterium]